MGIHSGHRSRMKQEFLDGGLEGFSDVRALELLLFFARPQGDVNPTAHTLLDTFGSLPGVLEADPQLLQEVPGVGENTMTLLKLIPALAARYQDCRIQRPQKINHLEDLRDLFTPYFWGARKEMSYLGCFDGTLRLLGVRKLSEGGPNDTDIQPRKVAAAALALNASAVVLAHNHTSGDLTPSNEDLSTTRYLKKVLSSMNITLYDHVIMSDDDMLSLREEGYMLML